MIKWNELSLKATWVLSTAITSQIMVAEFPPAALDAHHGSKPWQEYLKNSTPPPKKKKTMAKLSTYLHKFIVWHGKPTKAICLNNTFLHSLGCRG